MVKILSIYPTSEVDEYNKVIKFFSFTLNAGMEDTLRSFNCYSWFMPRSFPDVLKTNAFFLV